MVRTRNNRNSSGGGGGAGGQNNKDNSPTFKPSSSGNKKGRKRQLTESSGSSSSSSSSSSMLTPSCSSTAMALLAPSYSDMMTVQQHPQYLAPAPASSSFNNNFLNNNAGDQNIEESVEQIREHLQQDLVEGVQQHQAAAGDGDQEDHDIVHSAASDLVIYSRDAAVSSVAASAGSITAATSQSGSCSKDDLTPTSLVLPDDLKQNLECPVCARISLPPIMQCRNGHVTCNPCRLKVQSCPMCREIDIDIRNLFAEKAVTFMSIPCEFKTYGCRVEIQYKDKEAHERTCKFRPYICPYIECENKLAFGAVVEHVSTAHREECRRSDGPEITASMILIGMYFGGDGAWSPRVITCFGKTFFDVALTRDRWLHHWVWLLGEEEEAAHFTYEITAFKGNTKYVYGSEVASLRTSDDEIVSEGKCLSISDAIGRRLRDGDKIRYKLKLMRK